ncbi:Sac2 family-domain-containing protein [Cantharellus anzutake]|uniref:Sac2 family-domain-containing protein n=1 Tax=Cantharellus anzutake TaxID=1750568 RepID=UPI0019068271|nr:Sac2 family-domain-containing protein [Cantharellus anzutake]KAF8341320.1 Sac2 family-domain-containing protein [Cantharellus anzutake]
MAEVEGVDISFEPRAKDFIELHDQVEESLALLSSLESFLGTFQKDLTAVSGHISDLQSRSREFDTRLQGRRNVFSNISQLVSSITIPPELALTILDEPVSDAWIPAIQQLETLIVSISAHASGIHLDGLSAPRQPKSKAAKDLEGVVEGLRITAATKIRTKFLSLINPIRTSLTTNIQVLQTTLFINKYLPLYRFLQRRAHPTADEIKNTYMRCTKLYYETGMRRYTRSLGHIKAKIAEAATLIGAPSTATSGPQDSKVDDGRLAHGKMDGPGVILAYQADEKTFTAPSEALFRSSVLVLLDNASAEYAFIRHFFKVEEFKSPEPILPSFSSPTSTPTPQQQQQQQQQQQRQRRREEKKQGGDDDDELERTRRKSVFDSVPPSPIPPRNALTRSQSRVVSFSADGQQSSADDRKDKEHEKASIAIWKQIFDPVIPYVQTLITSLITPPPPLIPLLTMIRLSDAVLKESNFRGCVPLEEFFLGLRFQLWPLFQKQMSDNVESLKKLVDGGGAAGVTLAGMFSAGSKGNVKDEVVHLVAARYATLFSSVIALSEDEEEVMLFSNLQRMRQELNRLIMTQASKMKDPAQSATFTSTLCGSLLHFISSGERLNTHPKAQAELSFWREREEQAQRRLASTRK